MSDSNTLILVDEDGEYEVDAADCEESEDGTGVYCALYADYEDEFFAYEDEEDEYADDGEEGE